MSNSGHSPVSAKKGSLAINSTNRSQLSPDSKVGRSPTIEE